MNTPTLVGAGLFMSLNTSSRTVPWHEHDILSEKVLYLLNLGHN
jgi:hypothetical protein